MGWLATNKEQLLQRDTTNLKRDTWTLCDDRLGQHSKIAATEINYNSHSIHLDAV